MCAAFTGGHFLSGKGKTKGSIDNMADYGTGNFNDGDTFGRMPVVGGFGGYAPNGSASAPMAPIQPRGVASETDEFLAISMGTSFPSQPELAAAESSVEGPINPLAAKLASSAAASRGENNLFPIAEAEPKQGTKNFDTTFSEKSSKKSGIVIALIVVLVAAIFAGAFFFVRNQEAQGAKAMLGSAIEKLYATDAVFAGLDSTIGSGSIDVSSALEQSTTTMNALSEAEKDASEAARSRDLLSVEEQSALDSVLASISGRRSMLEAARMIQNIDPNSVAGFDVVQQVYAYLAEAEVNYAAADDLWQSVNNGGAASYDTMMSYLGTAHSGLQAALQLMTDSQAAGSDVDYTELYKYVDAYFNTMFGCYHRAEYAAAGDWATANAYHEVAVNNIMIYNQMKETMPATAEEYAVAYHSSASAQAFVSNYGYAREKCVTADAVVSGYVGSQVGVTGTFSASVAAPVEQQVEQTSDETDVEDEQAAR